MKEQGYQKKISDKYTKDGYFVLNLIKTNCNGISDLLILKPNEPATFLECKTEKGKLSEIQKYRLNTLKDMGFNTLVSYGNEITEF